ncbi:universal stress protein [Mycobacteroides abscessus subsp. abscessus]|nr:universal stress protein [Mycobacteroides abscessus subsp. abscessus]
MAVNEPDESDAAIDCAMQEGRMRQLPVLAVGTWQEDMGEHPYDKLDHRVEALRERYRDVRIYPVTTPADLGRFLKNSDEPVSIAVVRRADIGHVIHTRPSPGRGERTLLIVRD